MTTKKIMLTTKTPTPLPPKSQPFEVAVARKLKSRYSTLMDTFLKLDLDGDGYVTRSDLKKSLHNILGIDLTRSQMDAIFTRFAYFDQSMIDDDVPLLSPLKASGKHHGIRYADFVKYIHDTALDTASSNDYGSSLDLHTTTDNHLQTITFPKDAVTQDLRKALERKLMEHSGRDGGGNGIDAQLFLDMDTDRSGKITPEQFRKWIANVGLDLSEQQCKTILGTHYHPTGIDLNEFVQVIENLTTTTNTDSSNEQGNMESSSTSMAWDSKDAQHVRGRKLISQNEAKTNEKSNGNNKINDAAVSALSTILINDAVEKLCVDDKRTDQDLVHSIAQQIFSKRYTMLKAFDKFDTDRDGTLTAQDLHNVLKETMKLDVSEERVLSLIQKFDRDNDGKLNRSDFVSMISSNARTMPDNDGIITRHDGGSSTNKKDTATSNATTCSSGTSSSTSDMTVQMKRLALVDDKTGHEEEERQKELASKLTSEDIDIVMEFRRACQGEMVLVSRCFQKLDKDKSWTLCEDELMQGFQKLGIQVSRNQMKHIISRFDGGSGTGRLNYVQFIQLLAAQLDT